MKKTNKAQNIILKNLVNSNGKLDSYTLFKRSRINFQDFSIAFENLVQKEIIIEKNNYVTLSTAMTPDIQNILVSFEQSNEKTWRKIPNDFLGDSLSANSLYVPSRALLDETTFNIKIDQVD